MGLLNKRFAWHFQSHFVISMAGVYFKKYPTPEYFHTAGNIFKPKPQCAVVQFFKIGLYNTRTVVMKAEIHIVAAVILCEVNKAGITMFNDIIHQFLYNAKYQ